MIIEIINLSKKFNNFSAIDNISFKIRNPGILGLLGTNGAGKTTLMGMILGLIQPTFGKIRIFDQEYSFNKYDILKKINYESPYIDLPKKLTVKQNLILYARLYGVENHLEKIMKLSDSIKISDILDKKFGNLSAGQKTKVGICKALINSPELLLLDEPTASLDPETSIFVRDFLLNYQKKTQSAIIIASHNMQEVESICDRIIILNKGKIMFDEKTNDLIKKEKSKSLEDLFLNLDG